jgi:hypothetical protein
VGPDVYDRHVLAICPTLQRSLGIQSTLHPEFHPDRHSVVLQHASYRHSRGVVDGVLRIRLSSGKAITSAICNRPHSKLQVKAHKI